MTSHMSFEPRRKKQTTQEGITLRAALAELRAANLQIALDDMRKQRDMWRARAECLTGVPLREGIPPVRTGFLARIGIGKARYE
jgi:hypothetical protein